MSRRRTSGDYWVGGSEKRMPSEGAAISLAITLACRAEEPKRFGVFNAADGDRQVARVERHQDRTVTIEALS